MRSLVTPHIWDNNTSKYFISSNVLYLDRGKSRRMLQIKGNFGLCSIKAGFKTAVYSKIIIHTLPAIDCRTKHVARCLNSRTDSMAFAFAQEPRRFSIHGILKKNS